MVVCEKVTITERDGVINNWLVQYEDDAAGTAARKDCLAHLVMECRCLDIVREPHHVVGPGDEPAVSWGDLMELVVADSD